VWDGTANPYRSCSAIEQRQKDPASTTGLQAIDWGSTDDELPDMVGRLAILSQATL